MAANPLAPSGFSTARQFAGGVPNYGNREARIAYNYTAAQIAYGDPVILFTDGTIRLYTKGLTTCFGIFRGCKYLNPNSGRMDWFAGWTAPTLPSTTVVECSIDADPLMTLQCQMRGTALTQASVGLNVDIFTGTSGVPTLAPALISTCALDGTAANTATLPFRLLRLVPAPVNSGPFGYNELNDNQIWEVAINTSPNPTGTRTGQA
jgi:hypothetical protein